jgi:hypothetical protein
LENFNLFDLLNKILSQKQTLDSKKDNASTQKQGDPTRTTPLPTYYTNSSIVSLIKRHEELSKKIDNDNNKK